MSSGDLLYWPSGLYVTYLGFVARFWRGNYQIAVGIVILLYHDGYFMSGFLNDSDIDL